MPEPETTITLTTLARRVGLDLTVLKPELVVGATSVALVLEPIRG